MKKFLCSIVGLLFVVNCTVYGQEIAEESIRKNEISVSINNLFLRNLALKYSRNISDDLWFRVGLINLNVNVSNNLPMVGGFKTTDTQLNGGIMIGIEKHKLIDSRLEFIYGLNTQMTYRYFNHNTQDPSVPVSQRDNEMIKYIPGIGFNIGFFYLLNKKLSLGIETNPSLTYYFERRNNSESGIPDKNNGFDFSMSNSEGFLVTLKYGF